MRDLKDSVPGDDWYCQRCDFLIYNNLTPSDVQCIFCQDLTGILIPLSSGYNRHDRDCGWVHITCVNFNKDIYFKEVQMKVRVYDDSIGSAPSNG